MAKILRNARLWRAEAPPTQGDGLALCSWPAGAEWPYDPPLGHYRSEKRLSVPRVAKEGKLSLVETEQRYDCDGRFLTEQDEIEWVGGRFGSSALMGETLMNGDVGIFITADEGTGLVVEFASEGTFCCPPTAVRKRRR